MAWTSNLAPILLLAAAGCGAPPTASPAPGPAAPDVARLADELLSAPPHEWLVRTEPVLRGGSPAAAAVTARLRATPGAPGAQAAIAVLGRIGGPDAAALLQELVADRGPLAAEAALALGELGAADAVPVLRSCVDDRFADPTLRTAAACSLVHLGHRAEAARLLRGVLLAGTPAGQSLQQELGLPERPRWALERYLVQRMLLRDAPTDFGLDTDASWPELEAATARIVAWLDPQGASRR